MKLYKHKPVTASCNKTEAKSTNSCRTLYSSKAPKAETTPVKASYDNDDEYYHVQEMGEVLNDTLTQMIEDRFETDEVIYEGAYEDVDWAIHFQNDDGDYSFYLDWNYDDLAKCESDEDAVALAEKYYDEIVEKFNNGDYTVH